MSQAKLRVLHLVARTDTGGLYRYVAQLCDALHARGHEAVVAGELHEARTQFTGKSWQWLEVPAGGSFWRMYQEARVLRRYLMEHPVDVIHAHYRKPVLTARVASRGIELPSLGTSGGAAGLVDGRRKGIPILFTLHLSGIPIRGIWRVLSDFGDHTHAASVDARDWLVRQAGVAEEKISVIPHGVEARNYPQVTGKLRETARLKLGLPPDATVGLYVGRFEDPKNEAWLLEVAEAVQARQHGREYQFALVGTGPNESKLKEMIRTRGLGEKVKVYDFGDPVLFYHAADCLLLPSAIEGFSLVTLEAMAAGIPVLRTKTAGTTETIVENVTGRSVPVDRDQFVQAAAAFLQDRGELARMGSAAAAHVRKFLTYEKQVEETVALYRKMAGKGRD